MPRPTLPHSGRAALLVLLPLAVTVLAAGCGGGTKGVSAATTTTTAPGTARARFTACLEAHGVPAAEATRGFGLRRNPGNGSAGTAASSTPPTTTAGFGAAFQACRSDLPRGSGAGAFRNTAAGRAYLQCLQLHGVTIPTTVPGSAPRTGTGGGFGAIASNPAFQSARAACAALAPNRDRAPGGSASTTPTTAAA